ncbi:MAG: TetR/AcrR family transcriptional regulator [Acidimicrobiales bacterium]|nr:TetR/AcrR family transcriptional regulator [Acidimicrobiales bacterium]
MADDAQDNARRRIADAAITVIARDGLDALSIRRVASEAGVAIGTVQHHYPTRADLVVATLERTARRQQARAMGVPRSTTLFDTLTERLLTLLPHDEDSRQEAIAWVALAAAAARDPIVGPIQRRIVSESIHGIAALLTQAINAEELPSVSDPIELAQRLDVIVDGYLLHTTAQHLTADPTTESRFRETLAAIAGCPTTPA